MFSIKKSIQIVIKYYINIYISPGFTLKGRFLLGFFSSLAHAAKVVSWQACEKTRFESHFFP